MTNSYDVDHGLSQCPPGPLEPVEIAQQDDTLARTGNTARDQEMYAAGIRTGEENTKHNAAIRAAVPDGWKLVPVKATDEMEAAAENDYEQTGYTFPRWKSHYAAMLNAAPDDPGVSTVEDEEEPPQLPYVVQRILKFAGQNQRFVTLPNLSAQQAIDLANWIQANLRPAPAAGDARGATERHTIEGTISFMRSDAESQVCVCCPPKTGHIFSRGVDWDAWETGAPEHFGRGPDVLVRRYATGINANEGKRVRVTVEVLPDDLAAQRKGDA